MDKLTLAVAGCGYWGPNLVRNFKQLPNCRLKTVCDASNQRLSHMRRLYPDVGITEKYEELLSDPEINAIAVATPVRFHHAMAKAALEAGKHVFVEKPLARTAAEAEELVEIAENKGLTLMVGHTFLFSPAVWKMKSIIDSGDIGEVQYIAARRLNLGLFQKDINVAWDLAPHDISIILHLLDELPLSVSCMGASHVNPEIQDVTMMHLNFRRNRCAFIHNSWLDPKKVRQMTVVGSQRMIVYDDTEPLEKLKVYDARVEVPPHYDTFAEFTYSYHYGDSYVPYIKQDEPLKLECAHFLECIREDSMPMSNGHFGLEVVRILETSSESLKQKGESVPVKSAEVWSTNGHSLRNRRNGKSTALATAQA